jgi:biopolymer transport protein ExbD
VKKKFLRKSSLNEEMSLQITSMADIFTIILVFLLKSYSMGLTSISPSKGLVLPEATAGDPTKETIKVEISSDSILVDQKPVVALKDFEFPINELREQGMSQALYQALLSQRKQQNLTDADSTILLLADEKTPFSTLKSVMASAANTGFVDLKLVVVEVN